MVLFGMIDIASFLMVTAIVFTLLTVWILKSEANRKILKSEITKLSSRIENSDRANFLLAEEVDAMKDGKGLAGVSAPGEADAGASGGDGSRRKSAGNDEAIMAENAQLKAELAEVKSSMEEIYKALCEQ